MKYAAKVFYELFLKNRTGGRLGIPTIPLSEFYGAIADRICSLGGHVELRAGVEQIARQPDGRWLLRAIDRDFAADDIILALPFEQTQRLIESMSLGISATHELTRRDLVAKMAGFSHSPYISVLLWFDREFTDLDHAWLLDSPVHWFFHKSRIRGYPKEQGSYIEVVISGSLEDLPRSREELLAMALRELRRFFPESARANVIKSGVLKEARATFTVAPGEDDARPAQATAIPGLYLAGDWTATGWPSTMESACRSGRLAAGAAMGDAAQFMAKEPDATGLSRLFSVSAPDLR
jgi:predicted NAD/FAD-dependent oxidoreductase